jgi:hypothetical protein
MAGLDAQKLFDELAAEYEGRSGVTVGETWHNPGLKVNDKIFAMLVRGQLVVKLPAGQTTELIAAGTGTAFEPSPGRKMKEWLCVDPPARTKVDSWRRLIADAHTFVAAQPAGKPRPSTRRS